MLRVCLKILLCWVSVVPIAALHAQDSPFVKPAALAPAVNFWKRVYTEVSTNGGFIHDDTRLDVVYGVMTFPAGLSGTARGKRIEEEKKFVAATLRKLAAGNDTLSNDERRVRDAWPADATPGEFRQAIERVRFQLGQADRFKEGLIRSGAWRAAMQRTFKQQGLPEELAALPHVESSFNTYAYSKVGAAGIWQFMRGTGKRFLRIDNVVDERLDPYKATVAAANFMQQNYAVLQSWPLAITAYNHGAGGMRRAKLQLGTDDIGEIVQRYQSKSFGFASRNFYACFLAALEIDNSPQQYFPDIQMNAADVSKSLPVKNPQAVAGLARSLQIDMAALKQLNPSLMAPVWTGRRNVPAGFVMRVPGVVAATTVVAVREEPVSSEPAIALTHRVRQGDTLSKIASKYGTSQEQLAKLNNLRRPYHVVLGSVLKLPPADALASAPVVEAPASAAEAEDQDASPQAISVATASAEQAEPKTEGEAEDLGPTLLPGVQAAASADPVDYAVFERNKIRVEAAETLGHYADWLGTTPQKLRTLNKLGAARPLQIGQTLRLDFTQTSIDKFESRRRSYHQQLEEAFFAQYRIISSETHVLKKGESIWELSQKTYKVPVWLLRQYNPDLDLAELKPGVKLVIPRITLSEG